MPWVRSVQGPVPPQGVCPSAAGLARAHTAALMLVSYRGVCRSGPGSPAAACSACTLTRLCGPIGGTTKHLAPGPPWRWLTAVAATLHLGLTQAQLVGISEDLESCHSANTS